MPSRSLRKLNEQQRRFNLRIMFRNFIQSIDGVARLIPADKLLRDVGAYFHKLGFPSTRREVARVCDAARKSLMPAVVKHVTGLLELTALEKKTAIILNLEYYIQNLSGCPYNHRKKKYFNVFTPSGDQKPWICDVHWTFALNYYAFFIDEKKND